MPISITEGITDVDLRKRSGMLRLQAKACTVWNDRSYTQRYSRLIQSHSFEMYQKHSYSNRKAIGNKGDKPNLLSLEYLLGCEKHAPNNW